MNSLFFSLRLKFISVLALLLVITAASVAWVSSRSFTEENQNLVLELNSLSSVTIATQIQEYFERIAGRMNALSREVYLRTQLDADSEFLAFALLSPDSSGGFRSEKSLLPVHSSSALSADWYAQFNVYLHQAAQGGFQVFPLGAEGEKTSLIGFAMPYFENNGEIKGRIITGALSPQSLLNLIGDSTFGLKFLVNSRGVLLVNSDNLKLNSGADLTNRRSVKSFIDRSFNNGQFLTGASEGANAVISSFRTVGKSGVGLITEVPQSKAFGAVKKVQRRATLVATIILCLVFVLGTFFSESITEPISRLRSATKRVREGDFAIAIENTSNDEIGKLTEAFVRMAAEIKTNQEALIDQEKLVVAGRLARNIGHEFGNILQPLLTKLELLQDDLKESEMPIQVTRVQEMIEFATLGSGICKGLLTLSKQTSDAAISKPFLVRETAEKAVKLLAHELKKKDIRVTIEISDSLEMMGNESQIMQVLINLIVNSIHAVKTGGQISIAGLKAGTAISLTVADDGMGISAENLRHIFEPLFSTKGSVGNGLGLSISKSIVESHSGLISADSTVGVGTKMKIEFLNNQQNLKAVA